MADQILPAQGCTWVYQLRIQTDIEPIDAHAMDDPETWFRSRDPVTAWLVRPHHDSYLVSALSVGHGDLRGHVYEFADGRVFEEDSQRSFESMGEFLAWKFDLDEAPDVRGSVPSGTKFPTAAHPPMTEPVAGDQPQATMHAGSKTLRQLGVSGRACAPLERMGATTLPQLSRLDRGVVAETHGVSRESIKQLDELLAGVGLRWGMNDEEPAVMSALNDMGDGDGDEPEDLL